MDENTPKRVIKAVPVENGHKVTCALCDFALPVTDMLPHDWAAIHLSQFHPNQRG
jgi:hypothetical protein